MIQWIEQDDDPAARASASLDPWPIAKSPDQLVLTVAGGNHPTHSFWMQAWGPSYASRGVSMPEDWDRLIAEAESEIGPSGESCVIG